MCGDGGGGVESGGCAAGNSSCVGVQEHGDSGRTLRMASAGDSRQVTLAWQGDRLPSQH